MGPTSRAFHHRHGAPRLPHDQPRRGRRPTAGVRAACPAALGLLAALALATAPPARAQDDVLGFALDRFVPAEPDSRWFVLESLDLRGHLRPAAGLAFEYGHKPLIIYNADGTERAALVRNQGFAHAGGSLVLMDRLRLGVSVPVALTSTGDAAVVLGEGFAAPDSGGLGDARLTADLGVFGQAGGPFVAAVGVRAFLPTGNREGYTGDESLRLAPRVMVAGDAAPFAYAAQIGWHWRQLRQRFVDTSLSSELVFAAAAGVRVLDERLLIGPEIYGAVGEAAVEKLTPLEFLVGVHYDLPNGFRGGVGGGPGLTRGFGTPAFRVAVSLAWTQPPPPPPPPPAEPPPPPPPPPDRDGDGIIDPEDACPDVKGEKNDDPKKNGCPPDRDEDGIIDAEDACPDVKGVKSEDPKKNGCPPDRDNDGVIDAEDACPDIPGLKDPDPKKNGCPPARIEEGQIKITQQVKFKTGSAVILPESDEILTAVGKILIDHLEIAKIRVEGHTDNRGGKTYNKGLSQKRAAAVVRWLIKYGIDKKRLTSQGFGFDRPIDSNETEEGRQNNRRVEFHIDDSAKKPK